LINKSISKKQEWQNCYFATPVSFLKVAAKDKSLSSCVTKLKIPISLTGYRAYLI
jgi:hypothetical protein